MPRAALKSEDIEAFRRRAVDAAIRLFADHGYDGVSVRMLASELGVSAMTPYRYFENKEELFAVVRTEAFRRFADRQQRAARVDAPERLRALGAAYVAFATEQPESYRIMFELKQSTAEHYPALESEQERAFSFLLEAVRQAIDAGVMQGDPVTTAHLMWAQVHGLVSLHLAGKLSMGRSLNELCTAPEVADALRRMK